MLNLFRVAPTLVGHENRGSLCPGSHKYVIDESQTAILLNSIHSWSISIIKIQRNTICFFFSKLFAPHSLRTPALGRETRKLVGFFSQPGKEYIQNRYVYRPKFSSPIKYVTCIFPRQNNFKLENSPLYKILAKPEYFRIDCYYNTELQLRAINNY